jgi:hypothetical protein
MSADFCSRVGRLPAAGWPAVDRRCRPRGYRYNQRQSPSGNSNFLRRIPRRRRRRWRRCRSAAASVRHRRRSRHSSACRRRMASRCPDRDRDCAACAPPLAGRRDRGDRQSPNRAGGGAWRAARKQSRVIAGTPRIDRCPRLSPHGQSELVIRAQCGRSQRRCQARIGSALSSCPSPRPARCPVPLSQHLQPFRHEPHRAPGDPFLPIC